MARSGYFAGWAADWFGDWFGPAPTSGGDGAKRLLPAKVRFVEGVSEVQDQRDRRRRDEEAALVTALAGILAAEG